MSSGLPYVCGTPDALATEAARWPGDSFSWLWDGPVLPGVAADVVYADYQAAWDSWTQYIQYDVARALSLSPPDVIAVCRSIDGPRRVLAQSELADNTRRQKHQWYDNAEAWQDRMFRMAVFAHEQGHMWGLGHSSDGGLMGPVLQPGGPTAPTPQDVQRLLALGYQPRQAHPQPPVPPIPPTPTMQRITLFGFGISDGAYEAKKL